jgi:predicted ATPase/DNA-binding winged helix-turn-helix (wHTH) protein
MDPVSETSAIVEFGRFRILPHRRELLADGRPIRIGGRAFDVLLALIEAHGAVVGKDALMRRVWPNRVVEENNLQAQISALRGAFGADRELIRTIAGRGYQFSGEIRVLSSGRYARSVAGSTSVEPVSARASTNLPEPVSELIGRDGELQAILSLAAVHRLVTLTGAGGIGKTRLARETARELLPEFADGVWVAELAPLSDPNHVPATVAEAVGLELAAGAVSADRVANALGAKQLLLVLDNCEHVIDAAARMAEALLRTNPAARIIATSQEPLRAEGEWIYLVPPLEVPTAGAENGDDILQYSAIRLFVARACAAEPHFSPDRHGASAIAAICRRLDGIPLAIELAAARAAALGIEELASRLDDRFQLLTGGRRTALPRHQTLRATLDWSYELLSEIERGVLRRLAIFPGCFELEAASAVVANTDITRSDVVDGVANLVTRSLVSADVDDTVARYRMLDTTRAYALEKLSESDEYLTVARRHAEYYRDCFEHAAVEWETRPTAEWLADYGHQTEDVRVALDWAFSPSGDPSIGVALTAAAIPLWMHLSLMEECRGGVQRALCTLGPGSSADTRREMQLYAALAASLMYTRGAVPEISAAWTKVLGIAETLHAAEFQLRALWGLWSYHISSGQYSVALRLAQRFCTLAENTSEPADQLIGDRLIGVSQHYLGDQPSARRHIERMLKHYVAPIQRSHIIRFQTDQRVTARVFLARILWLQGFPDQAMRTAQSNIEEARASDHAMSLCYALATAACPIALLVGDLIAAEHYVAELLDHSARHALALWRAWGRSFEGVLVIKRGDITSGLRLLRAGVDELSEARSALRFITFLGYLAEALGGAGQFAEGLLMIDQAIERSERTEERWRIAELLRLRGELVLLQDRSGAAAVAEDHFRQALDWARRQGALAWELRAATSLARLRRDQGRSREARVVLVPIYDRFTEGFGTIDLKAAEALIDELTEIT